MNREELKTKLVLMEINPNYYSLNGELKPDSIILIQNYNKWEVFYLDERGQRNDERKFTSEDDACEYIYKLFKDAKEIENKFGIIT